jgi:flagella basal body P-ring formation protein FlgA
MIFFLPLLALPAWAGPDLDAIEAAVRTHVTERVQALGHAVRPQDVTIDQLGLTQAPDCPDGTRIDVESSVAERFRGSVDLRLVFTHDGTRCAKLRIPSKIDVQVSVPIAARPVLAGQAVAVGQAHASLGTIGGTPIDPSTASIWIARTALPANTPLTTARVKAAPDAVSGADIEIIAIRGGLTLRAPGRLLASARVGETVRASNLATDTVVQGVLVSPKTVSLER